jgi:hypothetical protein
MHASSAASPARPDYGLAIGRSVWVIALVAQSPSPFDVAWAGVLLMLAPLLLVPLALRVIDERSGGEVSGLPRATRLLALPAAILLQLAFCCEPGVLTAALSVPWLLVTALIALRGFIRFVRSDARFSASSCVEIGMIYLVIGGGWTLLSRAGVTPLDFKPVIVLLTGIHFHYAGFVLPVVTGLAASRCGGGLARAIGVLVVVSVPLVAVGITSTQLGGPPVVETAAALLMSLGGLLAAVLQWRAAASVEPDLSRALLRVSSVSLAIAMVFSTLYGLRHFGVAPGLDIPWMRVLHGTTNVFGFALPAVAAWVIAYRTGEVRATDTPT